MAKSKIIKELANNEISIEIALNRLLIIASDLDNDALVDWVSAELHGYNKDMKLPTYRCTKSTHFTYSGINGSYQVTNIPFTFFDIIAKYDENAFDVCMRDSVATLQEFVNNSDTQSCFRDFSYLSDYVYKETGIQCTSIIQKVPLNFFRNVLSEIKTRLLLVLIKLDKEYGCLDDLDINTAIKTSEEIEEINKTVNNYIYVDNSVTVGDKNKIEGSKIVGGEQ